MSVKKELDEQVKKHTIMMTKVFKHLRLLLKEEEFKDYYNLALAYFKDSKYFYSKDLLVQAFGYLVLALGLWRCEALT